MAARGGAPRWRAAGGRGSRPPVETSGCRQPQTRSCPSSFVSNQVGLGLSLSSPAHKQTSYTNLVEITPSRTINRFQSPISRSTGRSGCLIESWSLVEHAGPIRSINRDQSRDLKTLLGKQSRCKSFPILLLLLVLSKWLPYHPSKTMIYQFVFIYTVHYAVYYIKWRGTYCRFLGIITETLSFAAMRQLEQINCSGLCIFVFILLLKCSQTQNDISNSHVKIHTQEKNMFQVSNTCMLSYNHMT